jgi:hypothetical protein
MSNQPNDWESYEREFQYYVALFRDKNEMADAFRAFSAAKNTADGIKMLRQYVDEIKDAQKHGELMRVIGDLNFEIAETKMQLAEQIQAKTDLGQKVRLLEEENEKLRSSDSKPIFKNGLYYLNEDERFCTRCYDVDSKRVHVMAINPDFEMKGKYRCPNCKTVFE